MKTISVTWLIHFIFFSAIDLHTEWNKCALWTERKFNWVKFDRWLRILLLKRGQVIENE